MTLAPLLEAPLAVQAHVATVTVACVLGVWLLAVSRQPLPRALPWHVDRFAQ
jgi:uncharacterized membrane protein